MWQHSGYATVVYNSAVCDPCSSAGMILMQQCCMRPMQQCWDATHAAGLNHATLSPHLAYESSHVRQVRCRTQRCCIGYTEIQHRPVPYASGMKRHKHDVILKNMPSLGYCLAGVASVPDHRPWSLLGGDHCCHYAWPIYCILYLGHMPLAARLCY